jgi:hypothetical protein
MTNWRFRSSSAALAKCIRAGVSHAPLAGLVISACTED